MFFKRKNESKVIGKLTEQEQLDLEEISMRDFGYQKALKVLFKEGADIEKDRADWWKDVEKTREIKCDKNTELLRIDDDGNIYFEKR